MDLQAGEGAGERSLAIVQLHRGASAGRQRFVQRLIQRDVNAHPLGVAHPAGGLLRLRQLTVHRLLSRQNPGVAAGHVRREDLTRQGVKDHRRIGIHRGVAQAFFAEVSDDVSVVVDQRQHSRRRGGVDPRYNLGVKELRSLLGDKAMLALIVFAFTVSVYSSATVMPGSLHLAPIAVADMDKSQLSSRIINAFYRPWFLEPELITADEMDAGLDAGRYTFAINIPPNFQRDVLAGRQPEIQVNVDATRMSQAFTGNGYIQNIITGEVNSFIARYRDNSVLPVELAVRMRFNPNLEQERFGAVMAIINNITMLAIVLTGSALIREREHGTIEHLLVMPVTPFEIMMAKIWSMGLVVLVVSGLSLVLMVQGILQVPIEGSIPLFMLGVALSLFATTSIGIFMGTLARSMPQLGLLMILVLLPLQMLSGGSTPRESMPQLVQDIMLTMPTTHFVSLAQAILYRGASFAIVWPQFLTLLAIGGVFFTIALLRFRKTIGEMA